MTTRREVLKAAALTGLATACGRGVGIEPVPPMMLEPTAGVAGNFLPRAPAVDEMPEVDAFPLGVSSGDVAAGRTVVQCQYSGAAALEVRAWSDTQQLRLPVTPGDGGFVVADLTGLEPDTYYSYAFVETQAGRRSPVGRFRSGLGENDLKPLVFGAVACTDPSNDLSALNHAGARGDLDGFLLLGDTTYADGSSSLAQYRAKWAASLARPEYRVLRAATPLIATWDDHEVDNDWNPELISMAKLANARATFFEHLPIRRDPLEPDRVWRSIRYGKTCEVFVLDSRSERKPSTLLSGGTTYLSDRQLQWLKDAMVASPCTFKLLMNSVPITQFSFSAFNTDAWPAYVAQRRDLLDFIDANVQGAFFISGDHHFASVGRVSPSGQPGAGLLEALAGPGAQDSAPLWQACTGPQFDWAAPDNNYLAIHMDPASRELRLVFWGKQGQKLQDQRYTL